MLPRSSLSRIHGYPQGELHWQDRERETDRQTDKRVRQTDRETRLEMCSRVWQIFIFLL